MLQRGWKRLLLAAVMVGLQGCMTAPADELDLKKLASQPGTEITESVEGDVHTVEIRRAGVTVILTTRGDKTDVFGIDHSGHGAVMCLWTMAVELRNGMDACFPGQFAELRNDLSVQIAALNDFIARNSLTPTTPQDLERRVAAKERAYGERVAQIPRDELIKSCPHGDVAQMIRSAATVPREERMRRFQDVISVPRPPVMNPCL